MKKKTIITISRQFGSGGREIGKKLAEQLNIPFYDKELIEIAAKRVEWIRNCLKKKVHVQVVDSIY